MSGVRLILWQPVFIIDITKNRQMLLLRLLLLSLLSVRFCVFDEANLIPLVKGTTVWRWNFLLEQAVQPNLTLLAERNFKSCRSYPDCSKRSVSSVESLATAEQRHACQMIRMFYLRLGLD